jgi:mismatch-specific thymine-DNA glycosylase
MVPDLLAEGLDVVFVGYNPGRYSAARGHHFAGPGNYFWALLYDAGLTGRRLDWSEDGELPFWRIGVTNLVDRMTPGSGDLSATELSDGGRRLREKIARWRPRVVCLLGKDIYRAYAGEAAPPHVDWGLRPDMVVDGVLDYVAPNPSRRSTLPYGMRLRYFTELKGILEYGL